MTELEQARAHLRDCQKALKHARDVSVFEQGQWWPENMKANAERAVIAALSWVWDAQQRDKGWQVWETAQALVAEMNERIPHPQTLYMSPAAFEAMKDWDDGSLPIVPTKTFGYGINQ